jgi:hypothetical protein
VDWKGKLLNTCFICDQALASEEGEEWGLCNGLSIYVCAAHNLDLYHTCRQCGRILSLIPRLPEHMSQIVHLTAEMALPCGHDRISEWCRQPHTERCPRAQDRVGAIREYNYKPPQMLFHPTTSRQQLYYGLEVEVDAGAVRTVPSGMSWREAVEQAKQGVTRESRVYTQAVALQLRDEYSEDESLFCLEHDGSLVDGFEIVTHPCTLQYHNREFPWTEICEFVTKAGYLSHTTNTCGLHIHASKLGLGSTPLIRERVISKLMLLYWRHWPAIKRFSRRDRKQIQAWANLNYQLAPDTTRINTYELEVAKLRGHYSAINTRPKATIEFRVFRG